MKFIYKVVTCNVCLTGAPFYVGM